MGAIGTLSLPDPPAAPPVCSGSRPSAEPARQGLRKMVGGQGPAGRTLHVEDRQRPQFSHLGRTGRHSGCLCRSGPSQLSSLLPSSSRAAPCHTVNQQWGSGAAIWVYMLLSQSLQTLPSPAADSAEVPHLGPSPQGSQVPVGAPILLLPSAPASPPLRSMVASNNSLGPKVTDTFHQPLRRELGIPSQLCIEKHPRDPWLSLNSSLRLS